MRLFECLSSVSRIRILELLNKREMNISELAKELNISTPIITRHINILEESGLIRTKKISGKRGIQKICVLAVNELNLVFERSTLEKSCGRISIPIGQYIAYDVSPTCGLASTEGFIGLCDDPRYFSNPDHIRASLLWFRTGWVEYLIPSYLIGTNKISSINISLELCSEYPIYRENYPSDIHFYLNGCLLGVWTSPGDFGSVKGIYTPDWWQLGTQYGLLKNININRTGCFIDGIPLSNLTLEQIPFIYGKDLTFRIAVPADARNPGGLNLFGRGFGNYDQDIEVTIVYL